MSEKLELLLSYAEQGWRIFPCFPGQKAPATGTGGHHHGTTEPDQIRSWHENNPDYNWGMVTGDGTGPLLIDIEADGKLGWNKLLESNGGIEETLVVNTGGEGLHYWFEWPEGYEFKRTIKWKPGIDILGTGGYALIPPSKTINSYTFEHKTFELAPVPDWLLKMIKQKPRKNPPGIAPTIDPAEESNPIPEGERNVELTKIAGSYRHLGLSVDEILERLIVINEGRCNPPLDDREVERVAQSMERYEPDTGKETIPTRIVRYADESGMRVFHTNVGETFAKIIIDDHFECHRIDSKTFRTWLAHLLYKSEARATSDPTIRSAVQVLEGRATFDAPCEELHVRVAEREGAIYLDMADDKWRAIEIDKEGWRIVEESPVMFLRGAGMLPLPDPVGGGYLPDLIKPFIPMSDPDQFKVMIAWLVMAMNPRGPYPILITGGIQGSGKSLSQGFIRKVIDPNQALQRSPPRSSKDLVISAQNSWILLIDNISRLSDWLSDALCRMATGDAISTRTLYTDQDETLIVAKRPLMLNGITDFAERGDLLDRSLLTNLDMLEPTDRKSESELNADFDAAHPAILGALLDAIVEALNEYENIDLGDKIERMADFCVWSEASVLGLGLKEGEMIDAYIANRATMHLLAIDTNPVAGATMEWFRGDENKSDRWVGTAERLLTKLSAKVSQRTVRSKHWPKLHNKLSGELKRAVPNLAQVGIRVLLNQNESHPETGEYIRRAIVIEEIQVDE